MNYKYILFDLDGTLINSKEGIIAAAKFALNKMGIPETQIVDLDRIIGPPLKFSFKKFFNLSEEFANKAVEYYREYYRDKSILNCVMYEDIVPLLEMLKADGYILAIATSKPTVFAKRILDELNISRFFKLIEGANLVDPHSDKFKIITSVCQKLSIYDTNQAIMIGDRLYDINGANAINMPSIGVLYGFGTLEELQNAGATYMVNSVHELGQLLYSLKIDD